MRLPWTTVRASDHGGRTRPSFLECPAATLVAAPLCRAGDPVLGAVVYFAAGARSFRSIRV